MTAKDFANPTPISVTTSHEGGIVVVHVAGEVDMSTVAPLETAVQQELTARPHGLVMDLLNVDFCGSSGLRVLIAAHAEAESTRVGLRLVATGPAVLRTLEISGLSDLFRVHDTVPEAVNQLAA